VNLCDESQQGHAGIQILWAASSARTVLPPDRGFLEAHMAHEDELRRGGATNSPGQERFESPSARHLAERLVEIGLLISWLFIAAKYLLGVI